MPRPRNLAHLRTEFIIAEIHRRLAVIPQLTRRRAELQRKIAALNAMIALTEAPGKARVRLHNTATLVDTMVKVMGRKPMGIGAIAVAVREAGYQSRAKVFHNVVYNALILNPGKFRRLPSGEYKVVGQPHAR